MKKMLAVSLLFISLNVSAQEDFSIFWDDFKKAVKSEDLEKLVQYCHFPLQGNIDGNKTEEGFTEGEFANSFHSFFDAVAISSIKKTSFEELEYNDVTDRQISNLGFRKGYTLMIFYKDPEYDFESTTIFTFAYINEAWKLCRIDRAG